MPTMPVCLPDLAKSCYEVKTVPVITSISASSGYSGGGKAITINGHGFLSNNNAASVSIDSITCTISEPVTNTKIVCLTGKGEVSQPGFYSG